MRGYLVNVVDRGARRAVRVGTWGSDHVDRKQQLLPVALDVVGHQARFGLLVRFGEGPAHGEAAREEESVRHAAADREGIHARHERAQDVHLGAYLCAADDREERSRGILKNPTEGLELLL